MWRFSKLLLVLTILAGAFFSASTSFVFAAARTDVISTSQLRPLGLTRDWYFQVPVDRQRSKLSHMLYDDGVLFLVSDDAIMYAINAETGRFLWATEIGDRYTVILPPVVNSRLVTVINGSTISAFNRYTGTLVWQAICPGEPFAGCAMSEYYLYVPLLSGKIAAFNFDYNSSADLIGRKTGKNAAAAKSALSNPLLDSLKADNADDAEMRRIAERFEETKRTLLPAVTEEEEKPAMRLNPGSELPTYLMAFGKVWLPPVICHQEVGFVWPEMTTGEAANKKPNYDDFVVSGLKEQLAWISSTGNVFIAGIDRLGVDNLELRYDVRIAPRATSLDKDILTRSEMVEHNSIVAPLTYVSPRKEKKPKPAANQTGTNQSGSSSNSTSDSDSDSDEELSAADDATDETATTENSSTNSANKDHNGLVLVGTKTGYAFAIDDRLGKVLWQFSAAGAILERIAEIDGTAYICIERGGMHAVDTLTGKEKWFRRGIRAFLSASQNRLYVMGSDFKLTVLDRETGSLFSKGPSLEPYSIRYQNLITDQILLGDQYGLVQCLTEISTTTGDEGESVATPRCYWQESPRERIEIAKMLGAPDDNARAILAGETTVRERTVVKKDKKEKTTRSFLWDDDDDLDIFGDVIKRPASSSTSSSSSSKRPITPVTSGDDDDPFGADSGSNETPPPAPSSSTQPRRTPRPVIVIEDDDPF